MERVVVPDDFPSILSGTRALKRLQQSAQVTVYTQRASSQDELIQRLQMTRVVINIRAYSKFNETVLRACPDLKMIAVLGVGTDNIDLSAASRLGIKVSNTPGYSAVAVAEHALALMLAAARRIPEHETGLRAGRWTRLPMTQLHGKTLGIIGFGNIGRQVASLAKGIGPVTANIFLRELRGIWEKADPLPGDLCVEAARDLDLISPNLSSKKKILEGLKDLWKAHGVPGMDITDFEAALVRQGIENRRRKH
jgi:lactate dehydrogenase-like 2-hydroxyacid dehydrogenase